MATELIYTSVPKGLRSGARGFCTVAFTEGMPANTVDLAESLSGYRNVYQPHDAQYALNPPAFSHYHFIVGGERFSVLSRVCACAADYSGRTNKIAHHVFVGRTEMTGNGPAWIMSQPGFFLTEWSGEPHLIKTFKRITSGAPPGFAAASWSALGDAGWAGVLAQSALDSTPRTVYLIFQPGMNLLPLLVEAMNLVPPDQRWTITFNTYFSALPQNTTCHWRCCLPDSDALRDLRRSRDALAIDFTKPLPPAPPAGPLVQCARTGTAPDWPKRQQQVTWAVDAPAATETKPKVTAAGKTPTSQTATTASRLAAQRTPAPSPTTMHKLSFPAPMKEQPPRKTWSVVATAVGITATVLIAAFAGILWMMKPDKPMEVKQPVSPDKPDIPAGETNTPPPVPVATQQTVVAAVKTSAPPEHVESPPTTTNRPPSRLTTLTPGAAATNTVPAQTQATPPPRPELIVASIGTDGHWAAPLPLADLWDRPDCFAYYDVTGAKLACNTAKDMDFGKLKGYRHKLPSGRVEVCIQSSELNLQLTQPHTLPSLAWIAIGTAATPRYLIVMTGIAVKAEFKDTPDGYTVSLLNQPWSGLAGVYLTNGATLCSVDDPSGQTHMVPHSIRTRNGTLDLDFKMPSGEKEKIRTVLQKNIRDAERSQWEKDHPAKTLTNILEQARTTVRLGKTGQDIRKCIYELVDKYEDAFTKEGTTAVGATDVEKALISVVNRIKNKIRERCEGAIAERDNKKKDLPSAANAKATLERLKKIPDHITEQKDRIKLFRLAIPTEPIAEQTNLDAVSVPQMKELLGMSWNKEEGKWHISDDTPLVHLAKLPLPRPSFVQSPPVTVVVPRSAVLLATTNRSPILRIEGVTSN